MSVAVLVATPWPAQANPIIETLRRADLAPEYAVLDESLTRAALEPAPAVLIATVPVDGQSTLALFRALTAQNRAAAPRLLALVPAGDSRTVLEALAGGADWFLQEPYDMDTLVETVRDLASGEHAILSRLARERRQVLDLLLTTATLLDEGRATLRYASTVLTDAARLSQPAETALQRVEGLPLSALIAELMALDERSVLRSPEFQQVLAAERERTAQLKAAIDELTLAQKQSLLYARDLRGAVVAERQRSEELSRALTELEESYDATIYALAAALDTRDNATEGHSRRVTAYTVAIARALGVPDEDIVHIERGAYLHDLGKIGVPDAILHKPGPLTEQEWAIMRTHPELGAQMVSGVRFLVPATPIIRYHHERYDGKGYSAGLSGEAIPIGARIFAIADTFDAVTADRPYRRGQPPEAARAEILRGSGSQYDPNVVQAFLRVYEESNLFRTSGATAALTLRALRQSR